MAYQDPNQPFNWNFNAGPGYVAANDPAYTQALQDYRNNQAKQDEQAQEDLLAKKQQNLHTNTDAINASFDQYFGTDQNTGKNFYDQYANQLMDYWQPELDQQHSDAQHQLNYTFADSQPGGGSAPAQAFGRLQQAYDTAELQANDNAKSQANQLKTNIEGQRAALLSSVNGDTDPGTAAATTARSIGSIPVSPAYSQLGDIFSGVTGQIANAVTAARGGSVYGIPVGSSSSASNPGSSLRIFS
ncbi:MAG: hypothetical protein ACXU8U_08900 [Asticcacaulis sp.]